MLVRKLLAICIASAVTQMAAAQQDQGAAAASGQGSQPQIEEISVIGQFVPDEKRGTASVADVVDEQQFTRTGDSNIAESLKRVAGLSTVGGKYVYVRGLGERYSTTLLNGAILPSPEPINRVVPLDLFPTSVLESVLVQKTYSAQFPSEFGGGVLQMRTKKSTDEFFWNISSSMSMTEGVNFKDGYVLPGGDRDWTGYDDGLREAPQVLQQATAGGKELRLFSPFTGVGVPASELQTIGRSLVNNYNIKQETVPVNFDMSSSLGNSHDIGSSGMRVNYLAAIDYSNSWETNEIERNFYAARTDGLSQVEALTYFGSENSIDMSSIVTAGLDFNPQHNLRVTSVLLRKTDDIAGFTVGSTEAESLVKETDIEWIEQELFFNQLQGDHYFPEYNELAVNWRYSHIKAERDAPDTRHYRFDGVNEDTFEFSTRADGNLRRFSVLDDTVDDFGIDLAMTFYGPLDSIITPKLGYVFSEKNRGSEIRRYGFAANGPVANNATLLRSDLETILASENIAPNAFQIRELTQATDNYTADNELEAFYAEVELNFDDRFRFTIGARQEEFSQNVQTFDLFNSNVEINSQQASDDLLPALSATFINYDHQFRVAYSETRSRPDFRELSPAAFLNPVTGKEVLGNPDLKITEIKNYDFRWEWYFSFSDYVSFGLFYKEFLNPIEATITSGVAERRSTFINAAAAENKGAEFELYKRLDFLPDSFLNGIGEDFYVQSNLSYIESDIQIGADNVGALTNSSRPLQGQSDWLYNLQIGYEPISGTSATLLYHYYGERIAEVGIESAPDLIEQPLGELNFIFIHALTEQWKITAKATNLLDERNEITQGGLVTTGYTRGRAASLKIDYTF